MSNMQITLPDELRAVAERQVASGRYASVSEYLCNLIRRDQAEEEAPDEQRVKELLRQRLASPSEPMSAADFDRIRERLDTHLAERRTTT